ncbi:CDP-alcohol phosphatidyltransferase family protein [Saccharothrix variisporea]|uniref:CDP-alcohol phosphatidyltransferase-like enzyme n=1 Tax=Saccharothrix variisporea TaxID=543527 RepID=A0A495X2C5_9PSEU|nr:CDP-alcohol phosphatidyltransferase family protein [Saccharothrix variisporea]RKT68120.1 CDP-alcohol phosphatidyltransferase-like enzyme [Saccharothrix variisporea]
MSTLQHTAAPAVPEQAAWAGAQVLVLAGLGGAVGLGPLGWLAGLAYGLATWALLGSAMARGGVRALGPADRVTLARGLLVGGVTALVVDRGVLAGDRVQLGGVVADRVQLGGVAGVVVVLAAVALALDFVDGQVARRTGTASPLGARFDMEVDAFLILVLSVHAALVFGPWALAIGAMRYVFVAASWVAPWLRGELPPSFARKTVAAGQGVLLVVAVAGLPFGSVLVVVALAALVWSFGRDVRWLWRNRVRAAVGAAPVKGYARV